MDTVSVDEYFSCACDHDEHTVKFSYFPWDRDKELHLSVLLNSRSGLFRRTITAIKYVLGITSQFGYFDNWIMKKSDALRLKGLLDTYIQEHGLVVEKLELQSIFNNMTKVLGKHHAVLAWFASPNAELNGKTPSQAIDDGETMSVVWLSERLRNG